MTDALIKINNRYPMAQVPNAQSSTDVLAEWKRRGFTWQELTREQALQTILIEHDPLDGKMVITPSKNMDGLLIILHAAEAAFLVPAVLVADAAQSIAEYFTVGKGQVDLGTGEAMVVVVFKDGRLAVDFEPRDAPIAAKKLLAVALLRMIAQDAGLPIQNLFGALNSREK